MPEMGRELLKRSKTEVISLRGAKGELPPLKELM
jgi:hypothetical protein